MVPFQDKPKEVCKLGPHATAQRQEGDNTTTMSEVQTSVQGEEYCSWPLALVVRRKARSRWWER